MVCHDIALGLSRGRIALFLSTVILRHKVRGVNAKLSGALVKAKNKILRGREQASGARPSFTYEVCVWKPFSLYITSLDSEKGYPQITEEVFLLLIIHHRNRCPSTDFNYLMKWQNKSTGCAPTAQRWACVRQHALWDLMDEW